MWMCGGYSNIFLHWFCHRQLMFAALHECQKSKEPSNLPIWLNPLVPITVYIPHLNWVIHFISPINHALPKSLHNASLPPLIQLYRPQPLIPHILLPIELIESYMMDAGGVALSIWWWGGGEEVLWLDSIINECFVLHTLSSVCVACFVCFGLGVEIYPITHLVFSINLGP